MVSSLGLLAVALSLPLSLPSIPGSLSPAALDPASDLLQPFSRLLDPSSTGATTGPAGLPFISGSHDCIARWLNKPSFCAS